MHTRLASISGVQDVEAVVDLVRNEVLPVLSEQKGYRGTTVSADRSSGDVGVLTLWDTAADREASFGALDGARRRAIEVTGGEMTIETFEELVADLHEVPTVGSALMVVRVSMDPATIDANVAFFKSEVLPRIKAHAGLQAVRNMIDRASGKGVVGSVWKDVGSMKAAASDALSRRQAAVDRGITFGDTSFRELLLVAMS